MRSPHSWPKISVVLFTYNDPQGVRRSLDSLVRQDYPKDKLEVVVIDNGSTDDSPAIARRYTPHFWIDPSRSGPVMRARGIRRATGEYVYIVYEQDMEMVSIDFLKQLVRPLLEEKQLIASFTREYPHPSQPWAVRFIAYDSNQRDPLIQSLTPSTNDTVIEDRGSYQICYFGNKKIPPVTHMMFRKAYLVDAGTWQQKKDYDHDTVVKLVESGYHLFAYVPTAGIYHYHAKGLKHLLLKRIRNIRNHYFPHHKTTKYSYLTSRTTVLKITTTVIFANLLLPATIRGLIRFIKHRDWVLLMDPAITLVVTDGVLWAFLTDPRGRSAISNSVKLLFKRSGIVNV